MKFIIGGNLVMDDSMKRQAAKNFRYKRPLVKNMSLTHIREELMDIMELCDDVHWYYDENELINKLDGDDDETYELRMLFSDLQSDCQRMLEDMNMEWVPDCFDAFFVAIGAGDDYGGLGYDTYENDYIGLDCMDIFCAEDESKKILKRMKKDDLIAASRQCFKIFSNFISISYRYDCLKASRNILLEQNSKLLQTATYINELYEKAEKQSDGFRYECKETEEMDRIFENMPQEVWVQ